MAGSSVDTGADQPNKASCYLKRNPLYYCVRYSDWIVSRIDVQPIRHESRATCSIPFLMLQRGLPNFAKQTFMSKPHLLLINPNTSPDITESVRRLAADEAGEAATIEAVTSQFGARYISSLVSFSIAAHAVLDAYANVLVSGAPKPDAVIVGCFGDPGMDGLREIAKVPVVGFAESGMLAATARPGRFLIATVGLAWRDMLAGMARQRGIADRLAGIVAIDQWAADPAAAAAEIDRAADEFGAARVVIGGTGLIPVMPEIAARLKVELIDPHRTAIREAIEEANKHTPVREPSAGGATQFNGLSPALQQMLGNGIARSHP